MVRSVQMMMRNTFTNADATVRHFNYYAVKLTLNHQTRWRTKTGHSGTRLESERSRTEQHPPTFPSTRRECLPNARLL